MPDSSIINSTKKNCIYFQRQAALETLEAEDWVASGYPERAVASQRRAYDNAAQAQVRLERLIGVA